LIKYTISNGEPTTYGSVRLAEMPFDYYMAEHYCIVRVAFVRSLPQTNENAQHPTARYMHDLSGDVYTYSSSANAEWYYGDELVTLADAIVNPYTEGSNYHIGWSKSNYNSSYVSRTEQNTMMYPDTAGYPNPTWS